MTSKPGVRKPHIVKDVARRTGMSEEKISKILTETFGSIRDFILEGRDVRLQRLGRLYLTEHPERPGRNNAGEHIIIPAHKRLRFKASSLLKTCLNRERE